MADLEKVIKGLKMHKTGICNVLTASGKEYCPYWENNDNCMLELLNDALSLLKAQEPRVMTMEELSELPIDTPVFCEENNDECGWNVFYGIDEEKDVCFCGFKASADYYSLEEYGESWRCWTSRPADSERKNTPWE